MATFATVVYCTQQDLLRKLDAALAGVGPRVTTEWPAFRAAFATSECGIVTVPWIRQLPGLSACLSVLNAERPFTPVILVTNAHAEHLRHLSRAKIEEVVWVGELEHRLPQVVTRLQAEAPLARLAAAFESTRGAPPLLRRAFTVACRHEVALHSLTDVARVVGCHRGTLWYHWRRTLKDDTSVRMEDLLDWILLCRAKARKQQGRSWSQAASELGVHDHTLRRISLRLLRRGLDPSLRDSLAIEPPPALRTVLATLLPGTSFDNLRPDSTP